MSQDQTLGIMDRKADIKDDYLADVIPVLCVVDVFLSSHFSPFRGHYLLPTQTAQRKGSGRGTSDSEDKGNRKEGDEDCSSFHSVFSEDESEADRALDSMGSTAMQDISSSISVKTYYDKALGSNTPRSDVEGSGGNGGGNSGGGGASSYEGATYTSSSASGSDSESSVPTYLELCSNTTIAPSSYSNYSLPAQGTTKATAKSTMSQRNKNASLYHMAWRKAQPCDLDSREILLTVDYGGTLKVWSARRRELIIPVTTATRSISGAGTSCIVTGNFHTHINPDVSLLYEGLVSRLMWRCSGGADSRDTCAVHVGWVEHATCPASEQRHSSSSPLTLEPATVSESSRNSRIGNQSAYAVTAAALNINRAQSSSAADRKSDADSSIPVTGQGQGQGYDSRGFHDSAVSGMWISILAPCDLMSDTHKLHSTDSTELHKDNLSCDAIKKSDALHEIRPGTYQYSFVCINTNVDSQQTEAAVFGRGAIVHLGASLFPPSSSAKLRDFFSEVSQSFVVGRFSSSGLGYPFSVDIVTILKDSEKGSRLIKMCNEDVGGPSVGTVRNRLIKVINGISERTVDQKVGTRNAPGTGSVESRKMDSDGRGFIVSPTTVYDVLYSGCVTEGAGVGAVVHNKGGSDRGVSPVNIETLPRTRDGSEGGCHAAILDQGGERTMVTTSVQSTLPFSTDSLAGLMQTNLTPFDSMGCTYRVSGSTVAIPSTSSGSSSSSFTSILPPALKNMEILSRQGITELHQQHQPLEAVTYEILPNIPQTYGLVDMTIMPPTSSLVATDLIEFSVIRAIVVPFDALCSPSGEVQSLISKRVCRREGQLLAVLQRSKNGMRLLMWTDRDVRAGKQVVEDTSSQPLDSAVSDSSPALKGVSDSNRGGNDTFTGALGGLPAGSRTYTVEVTPDPQYGLGLRLDVRDGIVVVDSFKRHPHTDAHLACEACLLIGAHDELVSINNHVLKGANLPSVIGTIRSVVHASGGKPVTLVLQVSPPSSSSSRSAQDPSSFWKDKSRTLEGGLVATPYYFWHFHSCVDLTTEQLGIQSPTAADIGYDMLRGDIILGTLSVSNSSDNSSDEAAKVIDTGYGGSVRVVDKGDKGRLLSLFHLTVGFDDNPEAIRCNVVSQHFLSGCDTDKDTDSGRDTSTDSGSGSGSNRPTTLQLWRDMDPFSTSSSNPSSTCYISLISHPRKPTPSEQASRGKGGSKGTGLTSCCSIDIVKMQYSARRDDGCTHSQQQGVESLISVVTSTVIESTPFAPLISSSRQVPGAYGKSSSSSGSSSSRNSSSSSSSNGYRETSNSNDKECNVNGVALTAGYQLLLSPVRTSGA